MERMEQAEIEKPSLVALKFGCRCSHIFVRRYAPVRLERKLRPKCPRCKGYYTRFQGLALEENSAPIKEG